MATFVTTVMVLGVYHYRHHYVGIASIIIGTWMIVIPLIIDVEKPVLDIIIGMLFLIAAVLLFTFHFVFEEKMYCFIYVSPVKVAGWKGIWCLVILCVTLPILQFIPCTANFCSNGVVEDSVFALRQLGSDNYVLTFFLVSFFITGIYNLLSVSVI